MKQKIFLTSALAMGFVAPVFAEPSHTGEFPTGGLMQEDYTYTNAATSTNMDGVYSGTVNAVAEYDVINYIVNAGQYLPADSETVITCPAGSFCPGIDGNVQYNQTTPQGIQTCPTGYASSADGASSDTQCYRACDINNMGTNGSISSIAHATAISGNDYYGSGVDTCTPTSCENGYHVAGGNLQNITKDMLTYPLDVLSRLKEHGSSSLEEYNGMYVGAGTLNGNTASDPGMSIAINENDKVAIFGQGLCNTISGNIYDIQPYSTMDISNDVVDDNENYIGSQGRNGPNCWCSLLLVLSEENRVFSQQISDTFQGQTIYYMPTTSNWINSYTFDTTESCVANCATVCARGNVEFYQALNSDNSSVQAQATQLFNSVYASAGRCDANVININWSNADAADVSANNAGTATYGSDVRTPVKAQTIKGKTFKGWRFSKPEQTTTGN
jgi:hypothetical protein